MGEHTAGACRLRRELLGGGLLPWVLSDLVKSVTCEPTQQCTELAGGWEGGGSCGAAGRNWMGSEPLCSQSKWRMSRIYGLLGGL